MQIIFIGLCIFVLVVILFSYFRSEKIHKNTLLAFVGSMGTGKTKLGVDMALQKLASNRFRWHLKRLLLIKWVGFHKVKWGFIPIRFAKSKTPKPLLYSNIPIRISKKEMSCKLVRGHFVPKVEYSEDNKFWEYETQTVNNSIIFIDELGQFASQYDWTLKNIQNGLVPFIRFSRHWGHTVIVTDQTADSIAKGIRSRLGMIYFLNNFRKKFFFFYKIDCIPMIIAEDNTSTTDSNKGDKLKFFFGLLGKKGKTYDTLCHSELYKRTFPSNIRHRDSTLKSDYFIDLK